MAVCDIVSFARDSLPAGALAVLLFFWRRKRQAREGDPEKSSRNEDQGSRKAKTWYRRAKGSKRGRAWGEQVGAHGAWLYVGKDEDGTPFYVDTESIDYNPENPVVVRVWVKYKPLRKSKSFVSAQAFLNDSRREGGKLDHIRHRVEIDYAKNEIGDLELLFCAADGRVIDSVEFRSPEWKTVAPRSLYDLVGKTVDGIWRPDRFPFVEPELRVKIQEKLWEINRAFESFETASPEESKGS